MSDRTKKPPETPAAKQRDTSHYGKPPDTGHVFNFINAIQNEDGVPTIGIDAAGRCPHCHHNHADVEGAFICIGCPCEYRPCSGSGRHPRLSFTGEVRQHGDTPGGLSKLYQSHCAFCDVPYEPNQPMPRHWMIPWTEDDVKAVTFRTGGVMYGIEPTGVVVGFNPKPEGFTNLEKCYGDHEEPRCAAACCWLDLSDDDIDEVIGDGVSTHLPMVRMAQEIRARRRSGAS